MTETRSIAYPGVILRPAGDRDHPFLYQVYVATRAEEMGLLTGWSAAQKEELLHVQFQAQCRYYRSSYPNARYDVIVKDGEAIGRLYVARMPREIRIIDIALLPQHRNRGIGTALVGDILDEAARVTKFVSLQVEAANPAKRLYDRMGFVVAGEVSIYQLLYWIPASLTPVFADDAPTSRRDAVR